MDVKRYTPRAIGCRSIPLGKQGETNAVRVEFLCAEWLNEYPAARIELHVTIPDGTAYTAKLEESGSTRAWSVTEPYTAQSGAGTIELILRDAATSTVIKSVTGRTHVEKSPSADGQPDIPPDESGLNGYVRYDVAQELTAEERKRARENIGADGAGGVGGYYKPSVDAEGNLAWEKSAEAMPDAEGANIRGPEGKEGKTGATGPQGPQGTPGHTPYIGENGNWWINGVDTETPATPQGGGEGTVTGIQIGSETYEPNESGVVELPEQGGAGVPDGGTAGQILIKQSDANGDAIWKTPTAQDVGALPSNGTAADASKLGGKAPEYYLQPRNLLDNSDFRNPVNQRGVVNGNYSWAYALDRWLFNGTGFEVGDGVSIPSGGKIVQRIPENILNSNSGVTFAIGLSDGTVIVDGINDSSGIALIVAKNSSGIEEATVYNTSSSAVTVIWAALYKGEYTADNLPPYVPKGYVAELAECQRYSWPIPNNVGASSYYGYTSSETNARITINTPQPMIMTPDIIVEDVSPVRVYTPETDKMPTAIAVNKSEGNGVTLDVTINGATAWRMCVMRFNCEAWLDANL